MAVSHQTPDDIIDRLQDIVRESAKGADALYAAEIKLAECELTYDSAYQKAFLDAGGTVADRQAVAKLQTSDLQFHVAVAKAEVGRVKLKMKQLSDAGTFTAVIAKQVELLWKHP